jgi:predicted ATPase/class 3 adenylate cyclase
VAGLPTGTVTFLFTDVEGSTRLLHELGDAYADVLAEHRRVLREAFARHEGVEVDTQGDAFFVAFAKSTDALAAAAEGRDALADGPLRVRMGLHTGEPVVTDEGYVGIDVHRAARIASAGHGGQILLSQATRDLAGSDSLRDLGEHRLKDLTAPERIYQLGDEDFPPLKSLNATNLPVASNPLVGRARELVELQALLGNGARLVTMTGAGGSGKTRLGLQVAAELSDDFPGGVFFVPLAEVGQPDLVGSTIASTIGVRDLHDLQSRDALLLLDNFEHVVEAAPVISGLLSAGHGPKVLVTSRTALRVEGEHEYPLDPLPRDDAVEFLTQRARAVRPDFEADEATEQICLRLDGLPLALELAASRLRSLGSTGLLQRLDQRLPLLTAGRRDVPERQRTLRATIEWSYDLLEADLREVFANLSVFAGTFTLAAAEEIAKADLDSVSALVEASLLKPIGDERFLMLETIREFAAERVAERDDDDLHRRHAEHYLEVARATHLSEEGAGEVPDHELAVVELPNFRKALAWAAERGDPELGLRMMVHLEQFWVARDPFEGRSWLEQLLRRSEGPPTEVHARALLTYGGLIFIVGEFARGTEISQQSLAEYRALGDELGAGRVLARLISSALARGDLAEARALADESLEIHRRFENTQGEAVALGTLADVEWRSGNEQIAFELADQSAQMADAMGFDWWCGATAYRRCEWSMQRGRHDDAEGFGRQGLEITHRIGDRMHRIYLLAVLARLAAEQGGFRRAGVLWGAVEAEEQRGLIGQWEDERESYAEPVLAYGGPEFDSARAEGRQLTIDEAVAYGLGSID